MKTIHSIDTTYDPIRIIMMTETYQRKPLTVEAVQVTEENLYDVAKWCGGDIRTDRETKKKFINVKVLHPKDPEHSKATPGKWVLKSEAGFTIFSDSAFKSSWIPVVDNETGEALKLAFN